MKKILFFIGLVLLSIFGYSQSTLPLRADTIRMYKQGGLAHLKLETANKDSTGGVFYNVGNGVVGIKKTRKINDSTFIVGGDTISIKLIGSGGGGGGGGSYTSSNGIKLSGSNFKLGDYLGEHTTIKGAANAYDFYIDSANVFGATNANSISLSTRAGVAGGTGGNAGQIDITGGNGGTGVTQGGNGAASILQGGDAGAGTTNGVAGYVKIAGGSAPVTGNSAGGSVFVTPGAGVGSGLNGSIYLGVSPSATVRGNTVIGATSDDGTNKLQVTGGVRLLSYLNNANKDSALRVSTTGVIEQYRQTDFGWTVKSGFDSLIWDKSAYELQAKALNITINGSGPTKTITDSTILYDFTVSGGGGSYTNGYGLDLASTTFSVDTTELYPQFRDGIKVNTAVTYTSTTKRADGQSIIKLPSSNRLWMFYTQYGSSSGDNDSAEIRGKYSDDNGTSWSSAQTVVPMSGTGVYIPSAYFNNNLDTLYVVYYRQNSSTTGQIYQTYSVNFTSTTPTWAAGALIYGSGTEYYAFASDRVFRQKNGDISFPFAVNTNGILTSSTGNYSGRLLKRSGGNNTWALVAGVDITGPDNLCVEPGLFQTDDPLSLVNFYYRTRSGQVYFAQSATGLGEVYGGSQPMGLYAPNSTTTITYLEQFKTLLAAHNIYVGTGNINGNGGRRQMGFSVKHMGGGNGDHQQTGVDGGWSLIYRIDSTTNRQYIEPTILPVDDEVLVAYADGDYAVGDTFNIKVTKLPYYFIQGEDTRYTSNLVLNKTFNGTTDTWLEMYVNGLSQTANYIKLKNQSSGSTFLLPWWQIKTARNQGDILLTDIDMPTTTNSSAAIAYDLKTSGAEYALSLSNPYFRLKNNGTTLFTVMSNGMTEITRKHDAGASTFMRLAQSGISTSTGYLEFWNYGTSGGASVAYGMKVRSSSGNFGMNYEYVGTMNSEGVLHNFKTAANGAITSTNKLYQIQNNASDRFAVYADGNNIQPASTYKNWGTTNGTSGYGFFDNSGTIQVKNSGGSWNNIVDAGTTQTIAGVKTFSANTLFTGTGAGITSTSGTSGAVLSGTSFGSENSSIGVPYLATSLNTAAGVVIGGQYQRGGSFTAAAGDGLELRFTSKTSTGVSKDYALLHAVMTTVTNGAEVGAFQLRLVNGGGTAALTTQFFGNGSLGIYNGTAPSASITGGALLYSESDELKVRDGAGNITVISPHDFTGIPQGRSNPLAWAFYSEKGGQYINVDMYKLAQLVEKLTGEKLIYTGMTDKKPNLLNK